MWTRRAFLRGAGTAGTAALISLRPDWLARLEAASRRVSGTPAEVAQDEDYWAAIQRAFTLDRTIINLNNGHVCPSPRVVHEALIRYLDMSNQAPVHYMVRGLERQLEVVRRRLAAEAGCDPEEMAITRNSSEALQIAQLGLDLQPGDEILTTTQDYGRMLNTWEQRVRREGITLAKIAYPTPPPSLTDLTQRFERAITSRTKVIHFCHVVNLTGQIFPVKEICALARARGLKTIVDGAHAFAHFPFRLDDLGCDYYGTSLHKWLLAPIGTGFLYVRRENISGTWPLQPAAERQKDDIRKFEEIGTHPAANHNAIAEALTFHQTIGAERKAARFLYLRDYWAKKLAGQPRITLNTSLEPGMSTGIGNVAIDGVPADRLASHLWDRHRMLVAAVRHEEFEGIRVTPNIYTTLEELDMFVAAMEQVVKSGLPTA